MPLEERDAAYIGDMITYARRVVRVVCRHHVDEAGREWHGLRPPGARAADKPSALAVGDDQVTGNPSIVGNHGLARSRVYWGDAGIGSSSVNACNTFTAPRNQVR